VRDWANAPPEWLRIRAPYGIVEVPGLGRGETEAIALAEELNADAILIDERDGSRIARQRGIAVVGTLAVLAKAVAQNLVDHDEIANRLSQTNFRGPMDLFGKLVDEFRKRDIEGT
jgi:predicted nucleic acid-binding protein